MSTMGSSRLWGKIAVLIAVCGWALSAQAKYGGGSGEPNDPYLIYDANQMQAIGADANDWDKCFKLMADIDLGEYEGEEFNIIGTYPSHPFVGIFDGNDYTISNFTYDSSGTSNIGLFGYVYGENAEIKNLGSIAPNVDAGTGWNLKYVGSLVGRLESGTITDCYCTGGSVKGGSQVGGLVGYNSQGTITNCYSTGGSVEGGPRVGGLVGDNGGSISNCYSTGGSVEGGPRVAGLVGYNSEGTITNCYSEGSVTGDDYYVGGLVGDNWYGAISNCYSSSTVWGYRSVGGLVGESYYGAISTCYSTGSVTSSSYYVGGLVGYGSGTITNCYSTGNVVGAEKTGGLVGYGSGHVINSYWNIETSGQAISAGGEGKTPTQMRMASTFFGWGFCDGVWTINEDLDYPRLAWEEKPGEPIVGTFPLDGNGDSNSPYLIHTPEELNLIGLFPCAWDKYFKAMADIDLSLYEGTEFNIITNFAGIFDGNDHTISNFTYGSNGTNYIGFFGYVRGASAEIKNLGLIAPNVDAGTGMYVGLLVGRLESGTITECYSTGGSVEGGSYVGGLVGYSSDGTITNCYSEGSVTGASVVGGLVGLGSGTIANCYSNGYVWGTGEGAGGLAGSVDAGTMTNCYSSGTVWGYFGVGGLVGYNSDTITNCYSSSTVWGYRYLGGLVGRHNVHPITNCYSTGSVTGEDHVGGLIGSVGGTVTNCYSTGTVWGETYVGGLAGESYSGGTVNNSFWDTESSRQLTSAGGRGKTTGEMQMQSTFAEARWDIMGEAGNTYGNTWRLCNERGEYPKLSWQYLPGDFLCPDYVDFVDFAYLAGCWLKPECAGADLTFDGIADALDLTVENDNWLAGMPPGQASNQSPIDGAISVSTNADLNWTVGSFAASHDLYFGTSSPPPFIRSQTATVFDPGIIAAITKWYWRIDEVNAWGKSIGPVWIFTTGSPNQATNPDPVDGRTGVSNTAGLRWNAGFDAISHDVYFGTSNPPPFVRNQAATSFYPDIMSNSTKYYWRVDEVNAGGRTVGTVWTFTTGWSGGR